MLMLEGVLYTLGAVTASLVLAVVLGPMAFAAIETLFWFFTYRFTLTPSSSSPRCSSCWGWGFLC